MSTPTSVVVSSCEYWMRLAISLHLCVKKALLEILHDPAINGLPSDEQKAYQALYKFKLKNEKTLKNVICQFQWEKICHCCSGKCSIPCLRQGKTTSEDLDITCIVILIRYLTKLPPPQGGWNTPNANGTSRAAYVSLARQLRNDINHCAVEDISTGQEFNTYWQRVEFILLGLRFGNMKLFHDLMSTPLDAQTDLRITGLTGQMNLRMTGLFDKIDSLKDDIKSQNLQLKTKTDLRITAWTDQINTLRVDMESNCHKSDHNVFKLDRIVNAVKQQLAGLTTNQELSDSEVKNIQQCIESFECNLQTLKERVTNTESKIEEHYRTNIQHDQQISQHNQQISQHDQRISQVEKNLHRVKENLFNSGDEILSEELKTSTKKRYENVFVTFERSALHAPNPNKREDIVVGLSLIADAKKAFFQAADNNTDAEISKNLEVGIYRDTIQKMRNELQEVSSQETNYRHIMTSLYDYVVISGAAGCGKTTLCETLAYNWACNKIWVDHPIFQFVLFLRFREFTRFKNDQNVTAEVILSHFYPEHFNGRTTTLKKNTLLILDGFDECFNKYDLLKQEAEFTNYARALYDLLDPHNKKLPYARLVTSRPASCSILFKLLKAEQFTQSRLFEVTGFSMENIRKYVLHYFKQTSSNFNVQQQKRVNSFLKEVELSPILRSMMTIPFYCNGVCCLMLDGEIGIEAMPMTYTGLFSTLLTLFLRDHGLRNSKLTLTEVLKKESTKQMILMLSKFAFTMELEGNITFTKSDFPEEFQKLGNLEELVKQTGLIIKLDHEDEPFYQFLHYSFHEFLVALHMFHFGVAKCSTNIISMVGGLAGGLVVGSKSNLFAQKYARMFQSEQPIDIEDLVGMSNINRHFLAVIFEFQNKVHLKKHTTIDMRGIGYLKKHQIQHFIESSISNHIIIDSISVVTNEAAWVIHEELLVELVRSAKLKILFMKKSDDFTGHNIKRVVKNNSLKWQNVDFDRLILCGTAGTFKNNRCKDDTLDAANLFSFLSKNIERFRFFQPAFLEDHFSAFSVEKANLTVHSRVYAGSYQRGRYWADEVEKYCEVFYSVTVSFYKNDDPLERCSDLHSHNADCISPRFIAKVKAIAENHHQINNLKFAASCVIGRRDFVAPYIYKIEEQV